MTRSETTFASGESLWQWWLAARQQAIAHAVPPAEVDWLMLELTELDRLALRLGSFKRRAEVRLKVPLENLAELWQHRIKERVPIQYLAGKAPWRQFSLQVTPDVLIPRPETELLIDLAIANAKRDLSDGNWADLGTGSGAIALGLADAFPQATIYAVDTSAAALAIANANAERYHLDPRIHFCRGSWFEPLKSLEGSFSGIVSNPPYIPSGEISSLQPEVAHHEPHLALDGGADGLTCLRILVEQAPAYLKPNGIWLVELMAGQAPAVVELLARQGSYRAIAIHPDLAGIERFVLARKRPG